MEKPVNFQERVFTLFEQKATGGQEFQTYLMIFGKEKLASLYEKFIEMKKARKNYPEDQDDEWIILNPEDLVALADKIIDYGSRLPGGAQYVKLKNTVQREPEQLRL